MCIRDSLGDAPVGPGSLGRRWRTAASVLGAVLVRTWNRAVRLQAGLEARGLDGELHVLAPTGAGSCLLYTSRCV